MAVTVATVVEDVSRVWPCRKAQVQQLACLLSHRVCQNIVLHGASSTGKTGVLSSVMRAMNVRHASVTCCSSLQVPHLLTDVLGQLRGNKRRRDEGYAAGKGAETMAQFLQELPGACAGEPCFIVLDDAHSLAGHGAALEGLLSLRERTGANVAVVLLTRLPLRACEFSYALDQRSAAAPTHSMHFPQYSKEEALQVLMQSSPGRTQKGAEGRRDDKASIAAAAAEAGLVPATLQHVYHSFLEFCVYDSFCMHVRDVVELRQLADALWPHFVRPLKTRTYLVAKPTSEMSLELLSLARKQLLPSALKSFVPGIAFQVADVQMVGPTVRPDLPQDAKLMLVAGYLASHNKATLDKQVFDAHARSGRVGKKSGQGADRQAEDAREAQLAGPHTFAVSRLLSIFSRLQQHRSEHAPVEFDLGRGGPTAAAAAGPGGGTARGGAAPPASASGRPPTATTKGAPGPSAGPASGSGGGGEGGSSKVARRLDIESSGAMSQVATLAAMRLFVQCGADDPLEGGMKFMCAIPEDLARQLATEMGIELHAFLRFA